MKTKFLVAALSLCVLSTACSKDKNKVGECSESHIADLNAIVSASSGMEEDRLSSASTVQLESTSEACGQFAANQKSGGVCKATYNGEAVVLDSSKMNEACGKVNSELANRQANGDNKTESNSESELDSEQHTSKMPDFSDMFKMPEDMPDMPDMPDFED